MINFDTLTEIFVDVDDFFLTYSNHCDSMPIGNMTNRGPQSKMALSEMATIVIGFQLSGYRTFKHFYQAIGTIFGKAFPHLLSYSRFVELMPTLALPLWGFLLSKMGKPTGISFIDSTKIVVCHNKRVSRNKVFNGKAKLGKSSMGWFFGFKLHLIINDKGELLQVHFTPGNVDDRVPLKDISSSIFGKLFGDKGYISKKITRNLMEKGIQLITPIKKNMKNVLIPLVDKILLRKRSLIETINDQLKNICQIDHTRHRSPKNFVVNLISALIAYSIKPKKPSLNIDRVKLPQLQISY